MQEKRMINKTRNNVLYIIFVQFSGQEISTRISTKGVILNEKGNSEKKMTNEKRKPELRSEVPTSLVRAAIRKT
jgi:hypothetical protein